MATLLQARDTGTLAGGLPFARFGQGAFVEAYRAFHRAIRDFLAS